MPPDTVFRTYRQRIAELAAAARLPAIYGYRDHVEAGGLISYGPKLEENYRRAATYVDKHSQGRKARRPASRAADEIRVGHQSQDRQGAWPRYAAKLLARADEVIE